MNQVINKVQSSVGKDYQRFMHLLNLLDIQAQSIETEKESLPPRNIQKMKDYRKRIDWIMRDMLSEPFLDSAASREIRGDMAKDSSWDILLGLDILIDQAIDEHNRQVSGSK